jgi:hypothetical protein
MREHVRHSLVRSERLSFNDLHPGGNSRYTWIELSQKAGIDPHQLVVGQIDRLITLILEASNVRYTSLLLCAWVAHAQYSPRQMVSQRQRTERFRRSP